jgi:hypothetical protein
LSYPTILIVEKLKKCFKSLSSYWNLFPSLKYKIADFF